MYLLAGVCCLLLLVCAGLGIKIVSMRRGADELRLQCGARLAEDTNVGVDIGAMDGRMRALAAELDRQMKDLRQARLRYEQGDAELKKAVTNISHDLRTPLTALCGYMQLLDREQVSPEVREYLDVMKNRIQAMTKLTEELFQYSVIVSTEKYRERERISLGAVLAESAAGFYGVLKEKGITPDIRMPEEEVFVYANRDGLLRIFGNIISNAVKYSDGDLKITLHPDGRITFANHASGLDEVEAARLFERFYTVENGSGSTGLGLSIARTLTEQMGGQIGACREDDCFVIWAAFLRTEDGKEKSV